MNAGEGRLRIRRAALELGHHLGGQLRVGARERGQVARHAVLEQRAVDRIEGSRSAGHVVARRAVHLQVDQAGRYDAGVL